MLAALALMLATATATVPKPVLQIGHSHPAQAVVWLPDGNHVLTATESEIELWDSRSGVAVDFIRMPQIGPHETVTLLGAAVNAGGRSVALTALVSPDPFEVANARDFCRNYRFDLSTRDVTVTETKRHGVDLKSIDCAAPHARVVSANGRRWVAVTNGIRIDPARRGERAVVLRNIPRDCFHHAYVAPDGQFIAYLGSHDPDECPGAKAVGGTRIEVRSTVTGVRYPPLITSGSYARTQWLADGRYVALPANGIESDCVGTTTMASGLIVDAVAGHVVERFRPIRCMTALGQDGTIVGVDGIGHDEALWLRRPGGAWRRLDVAAITGQTIARLATSIDGRAMVVISAHRPGVADRVTLFHRPGASGPLRGINLPANLIAHASLSPGFSRDSSRLFVLNGRTATFWNVADGGRIGEADIGTSTPAFFSADAATMIAGEPGDTVLNVYAIAPGGPRITTIAAGEFIDGGLLPGRGVLWSAARDGTIRFYSTATWNRLLTLFRLPPNGFLAIDPAGRYDTNLCADTRALRWLMADRPWQSLAAQTFMRDYYEPQLVARTLECVAGNTCAAVFPPVPPAGSLNRVLPEVKIGAVRPGASPGQILVDIDVREGRDDDAANDKTLSGIHDLRLFRDGRLVGLVSGALTPGRLTLPVTLPTHRASVVLTAYAFNSDRIKSETSPAVTYASRVRPKPVEPRAYVVAVGVDRYAIPGKSLRFAVADASAVAHALAAVPGHATTVVTLTAGGERDFATKADLRAVLGILGGHDDPEFRRRLAASGIKTDGLQQATPDDVIILTFSGHGFADPRGHFYLLPSDAAAPDPANPTAMSTLVSSAELTEWLRDVDAGEMAIVIDACHSAASVAAGGFKPGPMGDAGLGQLAFDKGIRILAATQADDVALEDADLGLGVLTHVIVREGLARATRLDTMLDFAVGRLPAFARERNALRLAAMATRDARDPPLLIATDPPPPHPAKVQQPTLFDFTGTASTVVLAAPAIP